VSPPPTHPADTHTPHPARPRITPHAEHPKRAHGGTFWVFGVFLTHPAHPSSFGPHEHEKRMFVAPITPPSSLPYVEHQERALVGAFLVFGLFLTPPLTSSTSSTPFGACLTCLTSSPPPLTSNTKNMPLWVRSLCSACSSPLSSHRARRARPLGHV